MQSDTKIIKKHFQKSMDKYADNAVVQKFTAKTMVEILPEKMFEYVLEIGSGAGILTSFAAENIRYKYYYSNDLVDKSESFVKKYISDAKFFGGDFRKIKFSRKFDLIVSNACFQWFENLDNVIKKCKTLLNKDGILAFSTFSPDNFKEITDITGMSLKYKSVEELKNILSVDFEIMEIKNFEYVMNFDNPLKILAHMKNTGVNSLTENHWGVKEVKSFCENYIQKFPKLTLTYSPIIVIAKLK